MTILKTAVAAAALTLSAGVVSAATFATSVSHGMDTCSVGVQNTSRVDICNTLGVGDVTNTYADGGFISLGLLGEVMFEFGADFAGQVTFYEVSGGRNLSYVESLSFRAVNSTTMAETTGSVVNITGVAAGPDRWEITVGLGAGVWDQLYVMDTSVYGPGTSIPIPGDGFDIDAVSVAPVPLPAAAGLLLAGLGGLGMMRRRG